MITIPKGNSFDLFFPLVQKNYDGSVTVIDTETLSEISVTLIHNGVSFSKSHQVQEQGLLVSFPSSLRAGVYSVIIKAMVGEKSIQSNIRNVFQISDWNEDATWQKHIHGDSFTAEPSVFIAAPAEPIPQDEIVGSFPTADMDGIGGFDGVISGATAATQLATFPWTYVQVSSDYVYKGNGCVKFGSSSHKGILYLDGISADQAAYMLKFRAIKWQGANGKLYCRVTHHNNTQVKYSEFVVTTTEFIQQFGLYLDFREMSPNPMDVLDLNIQFENAATGDRCFVGDIELVKLANG